MSAAMAAMRAATGLSIMSISFLQKLCSLHVPILLLPASWRRAGETLEHGREMRLRIESDGARDLCKRHGGLQHARLGLLDTLQKQGLMGPEARRNAELRGKVHVFEPRHGSQVAQADRPVDVGREILLEALHAPFRQLAAAS